MPHLVLVGTLLVWSFSFLAAARVRRDLGLTDAVAARFVPVLVGAVALLLFRRPLEVPRRAWGKVAIMGILSVPVYNLAFFHGLKTVPTGTASLIIALTPVFTAVLAHVFLGEAFGPRKIAGFAIAMAGLFVVIRYGTHRQVDWPYLSSALILAIAPLSWAAYTVMGRTLPEGSDAFDTTYALLVVGCIPVLALARPAMFRALAASPGALGAALYLAVGCTLVGYATFLWALSKLPANETAAFIFLNPPLANLWAFLFEGTPLRPPYILGALILLAGVACIVVPARQPIRTGHAGGGPPAKR